MVLNFLDHWCHICWQKCCYSFNVAQATNQTQDCSSWSPFTDRTVINLARDVHQPPSTVSYDILGAAMGLLLTLNPSPGSDHHTGRSHWILAQQKMLQLQLAVPRCCRACWYSLAVSRALLINTSAITLRGTPWRVFQTRGQNSATSEVWWRREITWQEVVFKGGNNSVATNVLWRWEAIGS